MYLAQIINTLYNTLFRFMNPLLMSAIRNAKIQADLQVDEDIENPKLDSNGFPEYIIHDINVVVETFRVLIRSEWEYSTEKKETVHWLPPIEPK